jgi:hypothetical protein
MYLTDTGSLVLPRDQENHLPGIVDDLPADRNSMLTCLRVRGHYTWVTGIPEGHFMWENGGRMTVIPHPQYHKVKARGPILLRETFTKQIPIPAGFFLRRGLTPYPEDVILGYGNLFKEVFPRHPVIAFRVIRGHAALISPKKEQFLPGKELGVLICQKVKPEFRSASPGKGDAPEIFLHAPGFQVS